MKRKIMSILVIFVLILAISEIKINAATEVCKISLSPKATSVAPGETIDIELKMSNIIDADGLAAYSAKVTFDTNAFTYSKITGYGEWETPTYNEGNIVATVSNGNGQTTDQTFAILTLKVNDNITDGNYKVSISDIEMSNGLETLSVSSAEATVKVEKIPANIPSDDDNTVDDDNNTENIDDNITSDDNNTTTGDDNNITSNNNNINTSNDNNNKNNSTNNNSLKNANSTDTTSPSKMPYTGISSLIIPAIIVIAIVGGASYYNYKKFKKI